MSTLFSTSDLRALAKRAELVYNQESGEVDMLPLKCPPIFSAADVANLSGMNRNDFEARRRIGDLPDGHEAVNKRRLFTTNEAHSWVRDARKDNLRPNFAVVTTNWAPSGAVICMAGLTQGAGKTTAALSLAQGLNLRGHKILIIDLDHQATITRSLGVLADYLQDEETVIGVLDGQEPNFDNAIKPTYWPDIHIVSSNINLASAVFKFGNQTKDIAHWLTLEYAISKNVRNQYDVIIIDTPSSTFSDLNLSAIMASDILVLPLLKPENTTHGPVDSLISFLQLIANQADKLNHEFAHQKKFSFLNIVQTYSVVSQLEEYESVMAHEHALQAFGKALASGELPLLNSDKKDYLTVYDSQNAIPRKDLAFKKLPYDRFVSIIESQLNRFWSAKVEP